MHFTFNNVVSRTMSSTNKWDDIKITRDEANNITEALKNEEFRKLLVEYVEESQNPNNRRKFQEEIIQLEAERGVECKFVNPEPGFVIKTSINGTKKAFINVCSNHLIGKPTSKPMTVNNNRRLNWSIPYSLSPGREDYDKKGNRCIVYDVIFNPDTLYLAKNTNQFKSLVIETALSGVEDNYKVKLDQQNIKLPKLLYKGVPNPTVIRSKSSTPIQLTEEELAFHKSLDLPEVTNKKPMETLITEKNINIKYTKPNYVIKHRSDIDIQEYTLDRNCKLNIAIPKELVIEVNLPLLKTTKDVNLDINSRSLELICEKPVKYKLNIKLPYEVSDNGSAKFDADKRILCVTLPVIRKIPSEKDYIREDSGVESDIGEITSNDQFKDASENNNEIIETPFLNLDEHYVNPPCDYNRENKTICFILNVKNVDSTSIKTKLNVDGFHLKFFSIGSGHFPINYAFFVRFNSEVVGEVGIEIWDNNVTVQTTLKSLEEEDVMWVGLCEDDLSEKKIDSILDLAKAVEAIKTDDDEDICDDDGAETHDDEDDVMSDGGRETSPEEESSNTQDIPSVIHKARTYSETSAYEFNACGRRSILKNRMSRSLSESCADEPGYGFGSSDLYTWSDSCISEQQDGENKEMKKTVRFNQNVQEQVYRVNSSILGQRRKNQKRSRNKRRSLERRLSESENSEEGDEREKWTKKRGGKISEPMIEEEDAQTNNKNISAIKKKTIKQKNFVPQSKFAKELDN